MRVLVALYSEVRFFRLASPGLNLAGYDLRRYLLAKYKKPARLRSTPEKGQKPPAPQKSGDEGTDCRPAHAFELLRIANVIKSLQGISAPRNS